ncbi:MAG: hypothetical protein H6509_05225 [Bryobacterales bacterium]|nr:hypothetical protein [Acidobacteriota bacterium]MCB9383993.1 hypothetical protein [Bryobacterales bacterium]
MRVLLIGWLLLFACDGTPPQTQTTALDQTQEQEAAPDPEPQPEPEPPLEAPTPPPPEKKTVPPPKAAAASSNIVLAPLAESDRVDYEPNGRRRIGVHRELPATAPEAAWTTDANGAPVWRVTVQATGAVALRLHFTGFHVGAGRVTVLEADSAKRGQTRSYSGDGPAGDGELWSDIVDGDTAIVEYYPADSSVKSGDAPFRIDKVSHMWASPLEAF